MQPRALNNFRYRAKSCGYREVKIKRLKLKDKCGEDLYQVSAIEPISGFRITAVYPVCEFKRLCWYGKRAQKAFGGDRT